MNKFRVWVKYEYRYDLYLCGNGKLYDFYEDTYGGLFSSNTSFFEEVDGIIEESTGYFDKDGTEIYLGDIVEYPAYGYPNKDRVQFIVSRFRGNFCLDELNGCYGGIGIDPELKPKVIGNKHTWKKNETI